MSKKLKDYLPDVFNRENSNILKLFEIFELEIKELNDLLHKIAKWRSIDEAQGKSLDELGANVGQARGKTTDEIYRVLIRGKIARNTSDGTIDKMLHAISTSLNCQPSDIHIVAANETIDEKEPACIIIKKAPLDSLNSSGLSINQFLQIVESISAGGVRIAYVHLEGSFSFSSTNDLESSVEGFADIEGTVGGTLGGVFIPAEDYKLPI